MKVAERFGDVIDRFSLYENETLGEEASWEILRGLREALTSSLRRYARGRGFRHGRRADLTRPCAIRHTGR